MGHLVDAAVFDTYLAQMHGDVDALEELVGGVDGLLGNLLLRQRGVDAEDVDAVLHEAVDGTVAQDMLHPTWGDDSQTLAVGDVVVGRGGVPDAIMGETGIGKTTLFRLILGFIEPTSGEIEVGGELCFVPQGNTLMIYRGPRPLQR